MSADNELISKAKSGDDKALGELVERYMDFSREKAKGYASSGLEYDDIVQEGMESKRHGHGYDRRRR